MNKIMFKLYITGYTPPSVRAINNLRVICDQELKGFYELNIIDVIESPHLAEEEKIVATPTLIKELPPPLRKIIGDMSDRDKVISGLDLELLMQKKEATDDTK